jgi:hypothetical protein
MTLHTIDEAFVARWKARRPTAESIRTVAVCERDSPAAVTDAQEHAPADLPHEQEDPLVEIAGAAAAERPPVAVPTETIVPGSVAPVPMEQPLVERLLAAGRDQWNGLADEVEAARSAGHRVIAIAGGEPKEGRTTLIDCLARTLQERGRDVVLLTADAMATAADREPVDGGTLHDRRIVLVDAGVWFPPGPIRRQRISMASVGCDAAILVRRADREPVHSRASALAAVGVTVLGEVVTFASSPGVA